MSTINFYLKKANRKDEFPICMTYQAAGERFRYYTKLKTLKDEWDLKKKRMKKGMANEIEVNAILNDLENLIRQIEREAIFNKTQLSLKTVRDKFDELVGKKKKCDDFHSVFKQYLEQSKTTKTVGTVDAMNSRYNKLVTFEREKKYALSFDRIDKTFHDLYLGYLINDCRLLNNTVGSFIKTLKSFLNYATEIGVNKNMLFKKFKVFHEDVDLIYLNDDELMHLYNIKIPVSRLENVREIFCFECFTGLRFSDVSKIEHINVENELLKVRTVKTKDPITVPLNKYALAIIERNKNKFDTPLPTALTLEKTNVYLKELGQFAKFNDIVQITKYSGSKRIEIKKPKYLMMSTHAARRTFITLSLEKGMRPEIVMQIVGIKKWETFKKYIKLTDKIKLFEMKAKWNVPKLKAV